MLPISVQSRCRVLGIAVLAVFLTSCGGEEGAWSIQEGALSLTETLRLSDGKDFYFGEIYDVAVRDDGRIYVADGPAGHIKVLAPDGTLQDTIGRQGEGPGEFRHPTGVSLTEGDSLYVLDARRVSVLAPSGTFQYSFQPQGRGGRGLPRLMMVWPDGGGSLFAFLPFGQALTEENVRTVVRPVGSDGEVGDTLIGVRPRQVGPEGESLPFSRSPRFTLGPKGFIHHARNDSLHITAYDREGIRQREVSVPFDPVPVSAEERKAALKDRSKEERAAIREQIPETKPAFEHFLVDDEGQYWFGRPTTNPDSTAWWVVWPDEYRVATATLPSDVRLMAVRKGAAYGRTTTENGAPVLIRYRVRTEQ